jgi:NAD(P)H-nitrite reductase large subunit
MDDSQDSNEPLHPAIRGLKTVCRCNNIKYRTIERAIREGAHTMTQIANRTTATMGECGGSCTPDVQQMLEELAPKYVATAAPSGRGAAEGSGTHIADAWWVRKG